MPRRSYLSPQFRNLHTEQIGPSSHKNEYRNGVLNGNWAEDRIPKTGGTLGTNDGTALPPIGSTYTAQFADKSKAVPAQPMHKTPDMGRSLLFGHNPSRDPTSVPPGSEVPKKEVARFQEKRNAWRRDTDPDFGGSTTLTTTKRAEMDRVGDLVNRDRSVLASTKVATRASQFTGSFTNEMGAMGLRTPFPMHNTPLARR
eukprot:CAMPEP_0174827224 /NCGR_PEP_ID=MMETSP1114-20130205/560_1 /TAXON_ID=312471 /ORGANISM="Neobodo designis, Strain CCAP 1951/1" /LENGTH=199 /DNA_ID=CAMNT_0016060833 /DNA_START=70 /DNA_END=669 /DNA_ORIENTATION=+